MRLIFTSYSSSPAFTSPVKWLKYIESYTGILEALAAEHTVFGIERIDYEGDHIQNGVHYLFIRQPKKVEHFPFKMHWLMQNLQPDIVFINGFIFPLQIIQLRLQLGSRVKIIVLHRAEKPFTGYKRYLQMLADTCVDAYFFSSLEFGNDWIKKGIIRTKKKVHAIMQSSSIFTGQQHPTHIKQYEPGKGPAYLWVGRLNENKDPLTVVRGFLNFRRHHPTARLCMVYQSTELLSKIETLVYDNGNTDSGITMVGEVTHQNLGAWFNAADFIISGSHYEGSGIAVAEAMSCGCIPVLTDITSFRGMTDNGKHGLLYKPGDAEDLLRCLLQTLSLDRQVARAGIRRHFEEELSFTAIARKTNQVFESLLAGKDMHMPLQTHCINAIL